MRENTLIPASESSREKTGRIRKSRTELSREGVTIAQADPMLTPIADPHHLGAQSYVSVRNLVEITWN